MLSFKVPTKNSVILNTEILRISLVSYNMARCIRSIHEPVNPVDYE